MLAITPAEIKYPSHQRRVTLATLMILIVGSWSMGNGETTTSFNGGT
jgi:hypothetical protein